MEDRSDSGEQPPESAALQTTSSAQTGGDEPLEFFEALLDTHRRASKASGGTCERTFRIGSESVRLCFAGPALVSHLTPALGHLAVDGSGRPDLTIYVWDGANTGVSMPPLPWSPEEYLARGEIRGYDYGSLRACLYTAPTTLSVLNRDAGLAIFWTEDAGKTPYYEHVAPLRVIFSWWFSGRGRQLAHAAAVGSTDGGVLLVGKAGSGKSTTALACLDSPLMYASDDYCVVTLAPRPHVHSVYCSAKMEVDSRQMLPALPFSVYDADRINAEKAYILLQEHCPEKLSTGFPIRAILLPVVTGEATTRLERASPIAALTALAPSTMFQLPGATGESFRVMAQLVKEVPAYHLHLGTELGEVPSVIEQFLHGS